MASLDHIIKGMSANDVRLDAYVSQRNQVNYDIYTINNLPPAQPEQLSTNLAEVGTDCISRQVAINALDVLCQEHRYRIPGKRETYSQYNEAWQDALGRAEGAIGNLPSAQPEQHTCVNCGRTVNNGGWYADGRTRCPIEEHYALPKDGYCHLWEKRNVTDDDYPERREE
jgi:hypothetical protein